MKSEKFATATSIRRIIIICVLLFHVVANSSLFTLHSSFFIFHSSLLSAQVQTGKASFYAKKATGWRTANGERLHHDSMTCAHRTYPFGTLLKVTNLTNDQSVIVRVNDRGPFVRGRIVDLSWGAAKAIGMILHGIATVTVEQAYSVTIPLRPHDMQIELPKVRVEPVELPDTLRTIWQEDELIYHKKKNLKKKVIKKSANRK